MTPQDRAEIRRDSPIRQRVQEGHRRQQRKAMAKRILWSLGVFLVLAWLLIAALIGDAR